MTLTEAPRGPTTRSGFRFAYLMTAVAIGSIFVSGVFASIFSPDWVSTSGAAVGYTHQNIPIAAYQGWLWDAIALWMVLPAAMHGIRAKVTDRAAWTLLGLGVGGIWLAVMFVSLFAPVSVTGTAPWLTWTYFGEIFSGLVGIVLTGILCKFVKTAFFPMVQEPPRAPTITTTPGPVPPADDPATKLRQLAQLRDSGVINEADFEAKKAELLGRV